MSLKTWIRPRGRHDQRFGPLAPPSLISVLVVLAIATVVPFVGSDYVLGLVSLYLPLVLVALAADVMWGLNGIISFGHAVYFAAGAYLAALVLKGGRAPSGASLIGAGSEPHPVDQVFVAMRSVVVLGVPVLAIVVPVVVVGLSALVLGLVLFRLQSPEIYLPLLTLGIGVIATLLLQGWTYLGSSNGVNSVPSLLKDAPRSGSFAQAEYVFNVVVVGVVLVLYALFRRSRAGKVWLASGDEPIRLAAQGVPVGVLRGAGFGVSAGIAALGGALFVSTSGFIAPDQAGVLQSAAILIWVAVGGPGNFWGPLVGVLAISFGESALSGVVRDGWQLVLGVILVLVVLLLPHGLPSLPGRLVDAARRLAPGRAEREPASG